MPKLSKPFEGNYKVTANFGWYSPFNNQRRWHGGIDFGTPVGTPIFAIEDGTVVWSQWDEAGGGEMILIRADSDGGQTLFLHLQKRLVVVGQKVKRAQQIGTSGATGNTSGAHLHFEFWKAIDPKQVGIIATDEMAIRGLPAEWSDDWADPSFFNNPQPVLPPLGKYQFRLTKSGGIDSAIQELIDINAWGGNWTDNVEIFRALNGTKENWNAGEVVTYWSDERQRLQEEAIAETTRREEQALKEFTQKMEGHQTMPTVIFEQVPQIKPIVQAPLSPTAPIFSEISQNKVDPWEILRAEAQKIKDEKEFIPRTDAFKTILSTLRTNIFPILTSVGGFFGLSNQNLELWNVKIDSAIAIAIAVISMLAAVYLEWDKTKYNSKEKK